MQYATATQFRRFMGELGTTEGREKIAAVMDNFVRDREKADSLFQKIWPEKTVSERDPNVQRSIKNDSIMYLVETEPEARGMTASFRGEPEVRYYRSPRFYAPFYALQTERLEQSEMDLIAYRFDIEKMVREKALDVMNEVHDRRHVVILEGACQILQKEEQGIAYSTALTATTAFTAGNVNDSGTGVKELGKIKGIDVLNLAGAASGAASVTEEAEYPIQKDDFTKLLKLFPGRGGPRKSHLKCKILAMSETDKLDMNNWSSTDVGYDIVKETTIDGYKYSKVQGQIFATTTNTGVLRPGNIFAMADRQYLGGVMTLRPLKTYVDKKEDRMTWMAKKHLCTFVGNVAGVRKLELYAGSAETVTGVVNTAMQALYAPLAETELGALNNLVSKGGTVPHIEEF